MEISIKKSEGAEKKNSQNLKAVQRVGRTLRRLEERELQG